MSAYNIYERKAVTAGAAIAQWDSVKITTEGTDGQELTVIKAAAAADQIIGIALNDATAAGQVIDIQPLAPIVLKRCGASGVTQGDYVGNDGTDYNEIATLTLNGSGTTNRQVLGIALRTGAANAYVPVMLVSFVTQT